MANEPFDKFLRLREKAKLADNKVATSEQRVGACLIELYHRLGDKMFELAESRMGIGEDEARQLMQAAGWRQN